MALEAEIAVVDRSHIVEVNVNNTTSAFNGPHSIPLPISKTLNSTRGESEWTLSDVHWLVFALQDVGQIPNMDKFLRMCSDEEWELTAHLMYRLPNKCLANSL